jgi:hypothetical protein
MEKMKHAVGMTEQQINRHTKYANVEYDPHAQRVTGMTNRGQGDKIDKAFSASPNLLAVELALEIDGGSITTFMRFADGYGTAGYFPMGYDWSGIRDSTPGARSRMFAEAKKILAPHGARLLAMGLPEQLVKDITG